MFFFATGSIKICCNRSHYVRGSELREPVQRSYKYLLPNFHKLLFSLW
jgi:hypothetical protein